MGACVLLMDCSAKPGNVEVIQSVEDDMKEDVNVYNLIGPVLMEQDLAEANANVRKHIEYISDELKRLDKGLQDLEDKQNSKAARGRWLQAGNYKS